MKNVLSWRFLHSLNIMSYVFAVEEKKRGNHPALSELNLRLNSKLLQLRRTKLKYF